MDLYWQKSLTPQDVPRIGRVSIIRIVSLLMPKNQRQEVNKPIPIWTTESTCICICACVCICIRVVYNTWDTPFWCRGSHPYVRDIANKTPKQWDVEEEGWEEQIFKEKMKRSLINEKKVQIKRWMVFRNKWTKE